MDIYIIRLAFTFLFCLLVLLTEDVNSKLFFMGLAGASMPFSQTIRNIVGGEKDESG